jgi:hypothetical protein
VAALEERSRLKGTLKQNSVKRAVKNSVKRAVKNSVKRAVKNSVN